MVNIQFGTYAIGTRPKGLKQSEADIWRDFVLSGKYDLPGNIKSILTALPITKLSQFPFGEFAFQVHLLGGYPPPPDGQTNFQQDWELLTSLKADVIEKNGNNYTIYELKQRLEVSVLGQLLTYKWLFEEVLQYPKNTRLVAIGNSITPGIVQPLISNGIQIYVKDYNYGIPPNTSATAIRAQSLLISQPFNSGR